MWSTAFRAKRSLSLTPHISQITQMLCFCARLIPQEPLPNLGSFGWKVTTLCYVACYKSIV
jgi:hypothetical protein